MSQYEKLGVSSQKEEVHKAVEKLDKGLFPKAFCKIFPDVFTGDQDHCLIAHADGVGTKTSLGYLYYKETGDISVFADLAIDAIVMNLDDMLCVGSTGPFTITQNIGRNKHLISGDILSEIIRGTQAFIDKMSECDIDITFCGGETADIGDLVRTICIDMSMQNRMRRDRVIEANIQPNNVIVGLASFGQATYEDRYNSGIGSNGLTLGRHGVFHKIYREKYPETYNPILNEKDDAYTGNMAVETIPHRSPGVDAGKLILSPTRTYAPIIKKVLDEVPREKISAMIHCSGGGQTKCLKFIERGHIVKDNLFEPPPVFKMIQESSKEDWGNMYETFNMGSRFEIYCNEIVADMIIDISKSFNVNAQVIGYVQQSPGKKLTLETAQGRFKF